MGTASNVISGASTGASMGSAAGPWGALTGGVIGGAAGGFFGDRGKSTKRQKQQQELIDQLLSSLKGGGAYSDLFNMDENVFQKSYVEPAKAMFRNQIAPQIQQQYIASGQQRGTGMEDQLSRAGVEMDQLLNQQYAQMQQQAQERKMNAMNYILGSGEGQKDPISNMQSMGQGIGGYMQSDSFQKTSSNIFDDLFRKKDASTVKTGPKGFEGGGS